MVKNLDFLQKIRFSGSFNSCELKTSGSTIESFLHSVNYKFPDCFFSAEKKTW
jgi:hypothetical protein